MEDWWIAMPQKPTTFIPDTSTVDSPATFIPDETPTRAEPKSLAGFGKNVVKSGTKFFGSLMDAAFSPWETTKTLGKTALGTAELLIPGEQGYEQYPRAIGQEYAQRYGGGQNILDTLYNDPVGVVADVSTLAGGVGTAAKIGKMPRLAATARTVENVTNPIRLATVPAKAAVKGVGTGFAALTVRPGTVLNKQAGLKDRYRIGREVAEKGLWSPERNEANLARAIDASKNTVATSTLPPVARDVLTDMPNTMDQVMKRPGMVEEGWNDLVTTKGKIERDLPKTISQQELFDAYQFWNRQANGVIRGASKEMPGGPVPISGLAYKEALENARRELFKNDALQPQQRAVQTAMLAHGATDTAFARPHALPRMMAVGGSAISGNLLPGALIMATDSPRLGAMTGYGLHKLGAGMDAASLRRAMLLARLEQMAADPSQK
jgi:hypothetical protein